MFYFTNSPLELRNRIKRDDSIEPRIGKSLASINGEEVKRSADNSFASEPFVVDKLTTSINLQICSAPEVVPTAAELCIGYLDYTTKKAMHSTKYKELFTPDVEPRKPFMTQRQRALNIMLPECMKRAEESKIIIGAKEAAEESGDKTIFENTTLKLSDRRKRHRNNDPADIEGFLGPWDGNIDEKRVVKSSEEEAAELEEILAKRNKQGKQTEEKPLGEKTVLHTLNMSNFVPGNCDLRTALIFCYHLKKTAAESHRMLVEAYGEHALGKSQCFEWFKKFKSGDFDVRNEERGRPPKKFEDSELQALLDENDAQTQQRLADQLNVTRESISIRLKAMGKIQMMGKWVPHELNERQQEKRKTICEMLLARYKRKSFLHRIVTGDGRWIYFENPKHKRSTPGEPSTSTARPNRNGWKTMLCVWWDQKGVIYYELLKPGETLNTERYRQQMIDLNQALREKRPEYQKRQHKVILLHDDAPSHTAELVKKTIEAFSWEILPHAAYSPDLAPSDYHLFASMGHALAEQRFTSYENVRKWLDDWFASIEQQFFWRGIHKLPDRWEKCIAGNGQYFE